MDVVIPILVSIAVAAWFSAFVHGFYLWLHPAPGVTSTQLLFAGYRFYNRDNFEPKVWPTHRRFMISIGVFVLGLVATAATAGLSAKLGS